MKKIVFTLALMLTALHAAAQDRGDYQLPDGILAIELQVNPFSNDFETFRMAELKARLFLNDRSVVRLKVGGGYDTDTDNSNSNYRSSLTDEQNYSLQTTNSKATSKQMALTVALGYEYHFANTGRLDFYVGAEAGYTGRFYSAESNSTSTYQNYVDGKLASEAISTTKIDFDKMTATELKSSYNGGWQAGADAKHNDRELFGNIFTGVDFYIYKGLYIGTELGLSFKQNKQEQGAFSRTYHYENATQNYTEGYSSRTGITARQDHLTGQVTKTPGTVYDNTSQSAHLKVYVEPALRLGWIF